jgi:hypothetical protein
MGLETVIKEAFIQITLLHDSFERAECSSCLPFTIHSLASALIRERNAISALAWRLTAMYEWDVGPRNMRLKLKLKRQSLLHMSPQHIAKSNP